jgi:uncharacterized protein
MNPKLEVLDTPKYGKGTKGVFAVKNIKKNEVLAVFGGYIMKAVNTQSSVFYGDDYSLQISEDFILGPIKKSEVSNADYFNHSCEPNAGFKGQIFLVSMKDIKKGQEITFDYAMVLQKMKNVKFYKMKCLCGTKECRKLITENDWKLKKLQKKYNGYFQFFIQDKINKIKNKT